MGSDNLARKLPIQDAKFEVRNVVAEHLNVEPGLLKDETHFLNDLGLDWLDLLELIMRLETDFELEFADDEIDELHCVGDVIRFVEAHKTPQQQR
jgi:acyl carrier protein